jgi:uncharacterized iron-regulated membrane protein
MSPRRILFWLHLSAGSLAGIVIFIMSVTGIVLAYERDIVEFADRGFRHAPPTAEARPLPVETLLSRVPAERVGSLTALTLRSDPTAPAETAFGRGEPPFYLNPWTGEALGEGSASVRAFFRATEDWHRWLAAGLEARPSARFITGSANFIFLVLVCSGFFLWLPRQWSWRHIRPGIWFRTGARGRARDWNWHNTIGIWCFAPLVVITLSGVVMSFPWANDLVYRLTGSAVPERNAPARPDAARREVANANRPGPRLEGLNLLWTRAVAQTAGWKSITMRISPSPRAPVTFQIDSGAGRPDLRSQLTLDRRTAQVVRFEPFSSQSPGRRLRSWIRFTHTGEAGALSGETLAVLATSGGTMLVFTGLSLALRRLIAAARRGGSAPRTSDVDRAAVNAS